MEGLDLAQNTETEPKQHESLDRPVNCKTPYEDDSSFERFELTSEDRLEGVLNEWYRAPQRDS